MTKLLLVLAFFSFFQLQSHSLEHFSVEHEAECLQCLLSTDNVETDNSIFQIEISIVPKHSDKKILCRFDIFYTSKNNLIYEGRAPPFIS